VIAIGASVFRWYQIRKYKRIFWKCIELAATAETENQVPFMQAMACSELLRRLGYSGAETDGFYENLKRRRQ
jgi:hypothetical protein